MSNLSAVTESLGQVQPSPITTATPVTTLPAFTPLDASGNVIQLVNTPPVLVSVKT
jgi:hypothetical protein